LTSGLPIGHEVWGDTTILMNDELAGCYRDVFTGKNIRVRKRPDGNKDGDEDGSELPVAESLAHLPVALLERV
jgi:hypothetical protein